MRIRRRLKKYVTSGRAGVLAAAWCAAFAWSGQAAAFRTAGELPQFQGTERVAWADRVIRYRIQEDVPGFGLSQFAKVVDEAFGTWSGLECGGPVFSYVGSTYVPARAGDYENTIEWVATGWAARGFDSAAAAVSDVQYARTETGTWQIVEADLYINGEDFKWGLAGDNGPGTRDLYSVLTHEGGHLVGLLHPCEESGASGAPDCASDASHADKTMYPLYDPSQSTLSDDDRTGACFLYPGAPCQSSGCPDGYVCTPTGCQESCGAAPCEPDQVCVAGACVTPGSGSSCLSDGGCPKTSHCIAGQCVPAGAPGDPCMTATECLSNTCNEGGACARSCSGKTDCLSGQTCERDDSESGICNGPGEALGAKCKDSAQCLGGECLSGAADAPVCTRGCGSDLPKCPDGWMCATVEKRRVCTPVGLGEASECSASNTTPSGGSSIWVVLFLMQVGFVLRRFQKRRACSLSQTSSELSNTIRSL